jgi:hypothetical protein
MVSLLEDVARCIGHGAGPSGHQNRADCVNCARRLAPRHRGVVYMEPPKEFPCPQRIRSNLGSSDLTPESLSS